MKSVYKIKEYQSVITGKNIDGYRAIPERAFRQLEEFILNNRGKETDALELMSLSAKKGIGKVITAKNYVGIITLKDGTMIEILPKIYSTKGEDKTGVRTKNILIDMLKTLRKSPYKSVQTTHVDIEKLDIFEIFIRMFTEEVFYIVKRGFKCNYEAIKENLSYFRGKLLFSEHIKLNNTHKERSYVEYDAFTANRPENRLIKATLLYLFKFSCSSKNKNNIKSLLNSFGGVEASVDYDKDFSKVISDRNMKDYSSVLLWCRVFLSGKSFTSFNGSETAFALLFPMETLFESYIATLLQKSLSGDEFVLSVQDKSYYLFDKPEKRFQLKPDVVIKRNSGNAVFVLDTKWKILDFNKVNYGIAQTDMYQMFAYQKKYNAQNVTLIYPQTEKMSPEGSIKFESGDGVRIFVKFVDLFDVKNSISQITQLFKKPATTESRS